MMDKTRFDWRARAEYGVLLMWAPLDDWHPEHRWPWEMAEVRPYPGGYEAVLTDGGYECYTRFGQFETTNEAIAAIEALLRVMESSEKAVLSAGQALGGSVVCEVSVVDHPWDDPRLRVAERR